GIEPAIEGAGVGLPAETANKGEELAVTARLDGMPVAVEAVGFAVEGGDIIQAKPLLKLPQHGDGMAHAQGIVFFIGNREEEDAAVEGAGITGIFFRHYSLQGQSVEHVGYAPAKDPVAALQVPAGCGGQAGRVEAPGQPDGSK